MSGKRVLIATTAAARPGLARSLQGCPVDFACTLDEGLAALERAAYSHVVIGYLFDESHMFEFAQEVRRLQPAAHVLCVKAAGRSLGAKMRSGLNTAVRHLGCEGFFDLSRGDKPELFDRVFSDILACFAPPSADAGEPKREVLAAKLHATAEELRRLALG